MKKNQKLELRAKSPGELISEVAKKEAELMRLKMELATGKIKNTSVLKTKADELAVIKTILQEKII